MPRRVVIRSPTWFLFGVIVVVVDCLQTPFFFLLYFHIAFSSFVYVLSLSVSQSPSSIFSSRVWKSKQNTPSCAYILKKSILHFFDDIIIQQGDRKICDVKMRANHSYVDEKREGLNKINSIVIKSYTVCAMYLHYFSLTFLTLNGDFSV